METQMNLDQFRSAYHTGRLTGVSITANGSIFRIMARSRSGELVMLTTTRSGHVRTFRDAGRAVAVLHSIGARHFDIDTSQWQPEKSDVKRERRPNAAEGQRHTHETGAHNEWFREQVQAALHDPRPTLSDHQARERMTNRKESARKALEDQG